MPHPPLIDRPLAFAIGFVLGHLVLFLFVTDKVKTITQDRDSLECVIEWQLYYNHSYRVLLKEIRNDPFDQRVMSSYEEPKCDTGKYNETGYTLAD